jgi:twitching motility protein PilT
MPRINAFLQLGREQGCSDIHLAVGVPPMLRRLGDLVPVKYRDLTAGELEQLMQEIMEEPQRVLFGREQDLDFAYEHPDVGRFRVNLYRKVTGIGATFRIIAAAIPSLDELGLPPIIPRQLSHRHGMILVTGATGTGKTTTLAAMINLLNETRRLNIVTLEDPIEFVHPPKASLIVQREVGRHVESFAEGLRSALREDPDVILVGELRHPATIAMAMTAAETGHLVLGTLHTSSAVKTLDRIIDAMPAEMKGQTRLFLAQHLRCVISQKLVRTADNKHRKAVLEIMVGTPAIGNMIIGGKMHQIPSSLQTGRDQGMQLLDQALLEGVQNESLDPNDAYLQSNDKSLLQRFVTDARLVPQVALRVS